MLRAIDLQHIMVQSNSMERVQQTQQQSPDLQQRYLDHQVKEEKKHAKETVKTTEEATHGRVQEKQEHEESKRQAAGQHHTKDDQKREKDLNGDEHGELIDIIV
jgi:hypothetical protein